MSRMQLLSWARAAMHMRVVLSHEWHTMSRDGCCWVNGPALAVCSVAAALLEGAVQQVADGGHDPRPDRVGVAAQVRHQQRDVGGHRPRHPACRVRSGCINQLCASCCH